MGNERGTKAFSHLLKPSLRWLWWGSFFVYSMSGTSFIPTTATDEIAKPTTDANRAGQAIYKNPPVDAVFPRNGLNPA